MRAATRRLGAYIRAVLGPDVASVRQGAVALLLSSGGDLLAVDLGHDVGDGVEVGLGTRGRYMLQDIAPGNSCMSLKPSAR